MTLATLDSGEAAIGFLSFFGAVQHDQLSVNPHRRLWSLDSRGTRFFNTAVSRFSGNVRASLVGDYS